ncbi:myo-inositol transporter 2 [Coccidioides immitis H538.4]|uniref:Myo-inositol transporter 2 n=1 Tax=Coccidioides immitis H538.4 TaxID=396776 RepID=A0A0J8RGH5_COCIT|nr:myo-inositol transporter 2 [Coccidioides immitis H538.4]
MREKRLDPEVPVANDGHSSSPSVSTGKQEVIREETIRSWVKEGQENGINNKLRNPLSGMTKDELFRDVETFALEKGLMDVVDDLKKGALIAQDPKSFELLDELSEAEKELLRREKTHKWNQPFMMYFMTILCAGSAIVQGMDQTAVNGAQEFYFDEFNVTDVWQQGLLNGAPYLCSALIGCWTTAPLNRYFGRRGSHTWWNLLLARFLLGFAVGAKSTTTPVYGAECSPANIRGALVMMWQMWTAFGIMLGYIASVAFMDVKVASIPGFNWRLMLASTAIPRAAQSSFFVMFMQQFCGVNAIMYYSSSMFRTAGFSQREALITSLGCGFSFWIPDLKTRTACVATGIYLFMIVYSPGEGPVPFTYSAEAFPLYIRDIGMSFATATTWGFNFVISLTWPALEKSFKPQGAFGWYAAWNIFGWVFCYFCLPETKALSLEELDQVFSVPTRTHINHYRTMLPWYFKKYVLRSDVPPQKQLYDYE